MKITDYETQVLRILLNQLFERSEMSTFFDSLIAAKVEYTGSDYYLKIIYKNINGLKETIHDPFVFGTNGKIHVGFIVYLEPDQIILECHDSGTDDSNQLLLNTIRDYKLEVKEC